MKTTMNLVANGTRRLVIDLNTLPFINSAALGYLLTARKALEDQGGELVLARVQPAIVNILEMTELDGIFPAFESVEEAVDYLGDSSTEDEAPRSVSQDWR